LAKPTLDGSSIVGLEFVNLHNWPGEAMVPVNVIFDGEFPLLSNLAETPFTLDAEQYSSVEAFVQAIKLEESGPKAAKRRRIMLLSGYQAQRAGRNPNREIRRRLAAGQEANVYHGGRTIAYRSRIHSALIRRAIEAKFDQSPDARAALIATGKRPLVHSPPKKQHSQTSLPAEEFCRMLTEIRESIRKRG